MYYDIFNGDADGICALIQLRLAEPKSAALVTGIKRDIKLLDKITAQAGDQITVLDISMQKNATSLQNCLVQGATIFYADHHQAGKIPRHTHLTALIDTSPNTCTSIIINQYLQGKFPLWAITAAFGDNLFGSAEKLANELNLSVEIQTQLKKLGTYVNYNGYGSCLDDLHFAPDKLYQEMVKFTSPLDFISNNAPVFQQLEAGYSEDMQNAIQTSPEYLTDKIAVYILEDAAWARRVSGVFGNNLANQSPEYAHAILTLTTSNDYQVSVRAPLNNKTGADELCAFFPTGGGRKAAAGINHLAKENLPVFIDRFERAYS